MRKLIIVTVILISSTAFAKGEPPIAEITFQNNFVSHRYTLVKDDKEPNFKLVLKASGKKPKTKTLTKEQAEFIKTESTRILWTSEYRKPASLKKCTPYAELSISEEKTSICLENNKAVGMAYGLLNSFAGYF